MKRDPQSHSVCSLVIPPDSREGILYMGYSLLLSPAEEQILREHARDATGVTHEGGEPFPIEVPARKLFGNTVATLVARINRKASAIGGRGRLRGQAVGERRPFL